MAERRWTTEQEAVIDSRGQELLVSAAAGSGKTSVLVERIYSRVMDRKHPVDIDRFVVVTFTKAAAAEMKERLKSRMEKALSGQDLQRDAVVELLEAFEHRGVLQAVLVGVRAQALLLVRGVGRGLV
ncbi:MAG: UvrD-helicase domain-containing protein, partial [Eubacterium sp.]|nr:UvrD-helicase domain-containing protein [Eubacterium sp.]